MPRPKLRYCKHGHDIAEVGRYGKACSACHLKYTKRYQKENAEKVLKQSNSYKKFKRYGLDKDSYEALKNKQNNKCAICFLPPLKRQLAIDHNHKTGKIRGLLCGLCNTMLGFAKDDIRILQAGIEYLKLTDV